MDINGDIMRKVLFLVVINLFTLTSLSYGQVQLSVSKTYGKKITVGLSSAGSAVVSKDVGAVVVNDMRLSGSFNVPQSLIHLDRLVSATSLVKSGAEVAITLDCDNEGVRCAVFSGGSGLSTVLSRFYPFSAANKRKVAHKIADDIIYALTGEKGFALSDIIFVSDKGNSKNVYIADYDSKGAQKLTLNNSVNIFPDMAKDKSFLVYTSYMKGHPYLYRQDSNGKIQAISKKPGLNALASVSKDKDIALVLSKDGNPEVYTINRFGNDLRRITRSKAIDTSPCWSPDGKKIAFVSNRKGNPQIYTKNLKNNKIERLTYSGKYNSSPSWSPKGNFIAYASMAGNKFQIYIVDVETGDTYQITDDNFSNESPSWGPNGISIVYSSNENGKLFLKIVDIYEKKPRKITSFSQNGNCSNPKWIY